MTPDVITIDHPTTGAPLKFRGVRLPTQTSNILILQGEQGFLACGYLRVDLAERLGESVAIVRGVATYDDMLAAEVQDVSPAAAEQGVKPGMTGREALVHLA